jgi:hypothetical protein
MSTTIPVYPKEDPEYRKKIMDRFLQLVKNTRWEEECSVPKKSRGRKPKPSVRIEAVPRSEGEARVVGRKYNWFN